MITGNRGDSPISVVICTRDRGTSVVDTVASVLQNSDTTCELLVVDQSQGIDTETSLERFRGDPRFHYLHSSELGLARGRNLGITQSRGQIIAFTDDDCDVPQNWLENIADAFRIDPHVTIVFGCVTAAPHDPSKGFVPCYEIKEPFMGRVLRDKYRIDGMGACMAVRREAWLHLSGFDPYLGAGSPLRSAEENDFAFRSLIAGYWIYETPSIQVIHRGFRLHEEASEIVFGYLYGTGAMFAKHFRLGNRRMLPLMARIFWRWAFQRPLVDYSASGRRWLSLSSFCSGWRAGMRLPIDRSTGHFTL
jgi:glycosyltransferase involved in cell wall biosynthesis